MAKNRRVFDMIKKPYIDDDFDVEYETGSNGHYARLHGAILRKANTVLTTNGATVYRSTLSPLVDFNARAAELRAASESTVREAFEEAYAEDPVKAVKLLFQTGDIRGGKGERLTFNRCMDWLTEEHPLVARELLPLIPEYTRWDYLVRLAVSENDVVSKTATDIIVEQFAADRKAVEDAGNNAVNISLLAKWMPSLQTKKLEHWEIVRHLLKALHMQERDYRKTLSMLRGRLNVIEKAMSEKDYAAIDMEKMTSKQQLKYAAFLSRKMAAERHEYIQAVLRGEKQMNAADLTPAEIIHKYLSAVNPESWKLEYNEDYEVLWSMLPDRTSGNGRTLVVRDGSGSMLSTIGCGSSMTMLEVASALSIYTAERLSGTFRDKFITFSSRPELVDMSGCKTLAEKLILLSRYNDCSNTNIEATFDLILDAAVENGLEQDEIPSYLLILSDMEFDDARGAYREPDSTRTALFTAIRAKWDKAGYQMPTLVFWNLNGFRTVFPEIDEENRIIFLSGYSTSELVLVMADRYEKSVEEEVEVEEIDEVTGEKVKVTRTVERKRILSPKEQLDVKLSAERYDAVEVLARKGLQAEKEPA